MLPVRSSPFVEKHFSIFHLRSSPPFPGVRREARKAREARETCVVLSVASLINRGIC